MDVEAHPDAGFEYGLGRGSDLALALRCQDALGTGEILLGGNLEVVLVAGGEGDGKPRPLCHGGIVGQRAAGCGAVGVEDGRIAEALRGLGAPKALACTAPATKALPRRRPLEAVADRQRGEGAVVACERIERAVNHGGGDQGTRAVVDHTRSGGDSARLSSPFLTESCRVSPPATGASSAASAVLPLSHTASS